MTKWIDPCLTFRQNELAIVSSEILEMVLKVGKRDAKDDSYDSVRETVSDPTNEHLHALHRRQLGTSIHWDVSEMGRDVLSHSGNVRFVQI